MTHVDEITIGPTTLGAIIKGRRLRVPRYQRSYAWETEHVQSLFNDFAAALLRPEATHFLGNIVLAREGDMWEVVDGQQRLATTIIFAAAVRDYLLADNEETRAKHAETDYLFDEDRDTLTIETHLMLNAIDNEFFHRQVLSRDPQRALPELKDSHRRIANAFRIAKEQVAIVARASGTNAPEGLRNWLRFIDQRAQVILFRVADDANAFMIFETLNDRGLKLATADLLKNLLFSKSGKRIEEAQSNWLSMQSVLEVRGEDEVVTTFLRHLWSSKHGLTRDRELYTEIKSKIKEPEKVIELSSQLESESRAYIALSNPNSSHWQSYPPAVRHYLAALRTVRVEQVRPLLLSIFANFTHNESLKAMRLVTSGVIRVLVAGIRGGTFESLYSEIAAEISRRDIKNASALSNRMRARFPNDETFRNAFSDMTVSKSYLAKYYLREIEKIASDQGEEWSPTEDDDRVNLEHVLPKTSNEHWSGINEEVRSAMVNRLGNLCLLATGKNSRLGDKPFSMKKAVLRASTFATTKQIAEYSEWGAESIQKRQRDLASFALNAWPLSAKIVHTE